MMKNSSLESYTIKFLYNLSFDVTLCDDMLKVGLLPKITDLMGTNLKNYLKIVSIYSLIQFKILLSIINCN